MIDVNLKCVYFADPMGDPERECNEIVEFYKKNGFSLEIINLVGETFTHWQNTNFDILFFNYGGLLPGSGGMVDFEHDSLLKFADDTPSKLIVFVSEISVQILKCRLYFRKERSLLEDLPANILLEKSELIKYL